MRSENWHHPSVTDCVARTVFVTAFAPAWETCFPSMRDKANNASCHECFAAPLPAGRCAHANLIFVCVQATPFEWVYEAFAWQSSTSPEVGRVPSNTGSFITTLQSPAGPKNEFVLERPAAQKLDRGSAQQGPEIGPAGPKTRSRFWTANGGSMALPNGRAGGITRSRFRTAMRSRIWTSFGHPLLKSY